MSAADSPMNGGALELHDHLRIVRQRWLLIVVTTLVAIAIAVLATLSTTPQYESTARLFVSAAQSDATDAYQGGLFSQQRVKSYADLISGEEISRRVVSELKLDKDPRSLAQSIDARVKPDTVVLSISVTDPAAKEAQRLTQAVAETFVAYVSELETPPGKSTAPVKASIVDRATVPETPVSPQPLRNLAVAAILGLGVGIGLAAVRDRLDKRIKSIEDIRRVSEDAPLLGTILFDRKASKEPLILGLKSHSPRVESYRVLRTNLQFVQAGAESKVIVVTSAVPNEGKSSTAANLAISLAEAGDSVLLLEGDLRRPRATEYLHLEHSVGLTTVLVGRLALTDAIQTVPDSTDVLAAGRTPPNPAELLQSAGMKEVLDQVRETYDVVLIDAPPLLPVTDAALLASQADGAVIVVRHNSTTDDQLRGSFARLESVGARMLGIVVNMTPTKSRIRGYGYGYGYGYEYGYGYGPETLPAKRRLTRPSPESSSPGTPADGDSVREPPRKSRARR